MIKHVNKTYMWYKVNELRRDGLNKSQIAREVGIYRATVRKYLLMSETEFKDRYTRNNETRSILNIYEGFTKKLLIEYPFLSVAQIEDRLKENFREFPAVNSKTVYNFVKRVRKKYVIPKIEASSNRQYEKLPERDYGQEAQVDFGETTMLNAQGERVKVWFFAMVLSRSRYKFVYIQNTPFTTATAVYAHELAFEFFQGIPQEIIYDQDRVFMKDENLGDLLLTANFQRYCDSRPFQEVFCRKADPESKGKIENVVKYVKNNFLSGRTYFSIDSLNQEVIAWLNRTGNAKQHGTTKKIPMKEWQIECEYLLPYQNTPAQPTEKRLKEMNLRKDNTIAYKSNFYTVPLGSYKGQTTRILLEEKEDEIWIYDKDNNFLAQHKLSLDKGTTVRNTDHRRDKSHQVGQLKNEVHQLLGSTSEASIFLEELNRHKSRYYRDNLLMIKRKSQEISHEIIQKTILVCLEKQIFNGNQFGEIAHYYHNEQQEELIIPQIDTVNIPEEAHAVPQTSNINTYEQLMQQT